MKFLSIWFASLTLLACSTSNVLQPMPPYSRVITFEKVQKLQFGKPAATQLETSFGKPNLVLAINENEIHWFYDEPFHDVPVQSASFSVDKKTGVLTGALWIPKDEDPLTQEKNVRKLFNSAHFSSVARGQISSHQYSNDVTYVDPKIGVSFEVVGDVRHVGSISIGMPIELGPIKQTKN